MTLKDGEPFEYLGPIQKRQVLIEIPNDNYGHLNHALYLTLYEAERLALLEARGLNLDELQTQRGIQIVAARTEVDYKVPVKQGETVNIATGIVRELYGSVVFKHVMTKTSGRVASEALVRCAFITTDGAAIRIPRDISETMRRDPLSPMGSA